MNGGQWMIVLIVAIVMIASIVKTKHHRRERDGAGEGENAENQRLRHEVAELKERLRVLERITVEKENSLSREIDELRDR